MSPADSALRQPLLAPPDRHAGDVGRSSCPSLIRARTSAHQRTLTDPRRIDRMGGSSAARACLEASGPARPRHVSVVQGSAPRTRGTLVEPAQGRAGVVQGSVSRTGGTPAEPAQGRAGVVQGSAPRTRGRPWSRHRRAPASCRLSVRRGASAASRSARRSGPGARGHPHPEGPRLPDHGRAASRSPARAWQRRQQRRSGSG